MSRPDSTDCPDAPKVHSTAHPRTTRRAGVRTAVMSLALLTATGAAVVAPLGNAEEPTAFAAQPASDTEFQAEIDPIILAERQAAADTRSSRSASRGRLPIPPAEAPKTEPEIVGSRYTTAGVNVRKKPTTDAKIVTVLDRADKVRITDVKDDGWRQIVRKDETYWIKGDFLSRTKPKPLPKPQPKAATSTSSGSSSSSGGSSSSSSSSSSGGGVSGAACSGGSGVESGLGSNAIKVHRAVCSRFPQVSGYGGNRGGGGNHGSGRALDIMIGGSTGWDIANYVRANASRLGVTEVIYAQKIWTTQRAGEGWRGMSDRGSTTANHYDHVHVSVR
ncbi:MAG: SH3 domain-containing protein [Candidatus Nanopelagicales bacterium]